LAGKTMGLGFSQEIFLRTDAGAKQQTSPDII
jgi:hypothetical protein